MLRFILFLSLASMGCSVQAQLLPVFRQIEQLIQKNDSLNKAERSIYPNELKTPDKKVWAVYDSIVRSAQASTPAELSKYKKAVNKLETTLLEHVDSSSNPNDTILYHLNKNTQIPSPMNKELENPIQLGLSIAVLSFGLLLMLGVFLTIILQRKGFTNITFKIFGIILILTASLFLIVAGYSQEQITPIVGLLGTIAGFIFGSNVSNTGPISEKKNSSDPGESE